MDLLIKENELQQLDALIGNVPTKQGLPIVNLINSIIAARQQEAQAATAATKIPVKAPAPSAAAQQANLNESVQ